MSKVIITFKTHVEGESVASRIADEARKLPGFAESEVGDVGFGIKSVRLKFLVEDEEGAPDSLENALRKIDGIEEIDVESVDRAL